MVVIAGLLAPSIGSPAVFFDNLSYPPALSAPFFGYAQSYGTITHRFYKPVSYGAQEHFFMVYIRSVLSLNTNGINLSLLQAFSTNVLEKLEGPSYMGNGILLWTGPVTNNVGGIAMTEANGNLTPVWDVCDSPSWSGVTGEQVDWSATFFGGGGNYFQNPTELCIRIESVSELKPQPIYQLYNPRPGSFTLYALPGVPSYTIEYSDDCATWWPFANVLTSPGGPVLIKDPSHSPQRFYRALVP